jgi:hypothetical protein
MTLPEVRKIDTGKASGGIRSVTRLRSDHLKNQGVLEVLAGIESWERGGKVDDLGKILEQMLRNEGLLHKGGNGETLETREREAHFNKSIEHNNL